MAARYAKQVYTGTKTPVSESLSYSVYRHTAPSGKVYIGITKQRPEARWGCDGRGYKTSPHFYAAILKYGWDNILHDILASELPRYEAEEMEIRLISEYGSTDPSKGYNHATGGHVNRGFHLSEQRKAEISEFMKSRETTDSTREKLRKANLGKRHSDASKEKMRQAKLGKKLSEETRAKMRISNAGKRNKPVVCIDTGEEYRSMYDAELATGAKHENIAKVCRGKRQTAAGLRWRYANAG